MFAISVWELRKPIGSASSQQSSEQWQGSEPSDDEKGQKIRLDSITSVKQNGIDH